MIDQLEYRTYEGNGAKDAFTTLIETELGWFEEFQIQSPFLDLKRYKIVNTQPFASKQEALDYINTNTPFKMRPKCAGCVIVKQQEELSYLFFKQENI
tara:strand:+ start:6216 stop:6509 length:294 start_codon:yes stop_codon:yes gene_type:complete